jgi:hypothetical protein
MQMRSITVALGTLALLTGCGRDDGRGELSAEENRQLDEAEGMLDENVIDVSPDSLVANAAEIDTLEAEGNNAGLNVAE